MEALIQRREVQREGLDVSEQALEALKERFAEAIASPEGEERVEALEAIIADCAEPLESGEELSPEYSAFLVGLTRMHMLEKARLQLARLAS
ncbi:MAG: hypothetical protein RL538_785 [Candidatus Parcubacteria bacterium]|jgi:hypothetical protein